MLTVDPHPLLHPGAFSTRFAAPLGQLPASEWLSALLALDANVPVTRDDDTRKLVRDLLRQGGYKPAGRGKPASEYLVRAAGERALGSINAAVDACNVVSLHSGLPISVVDLDKAKPPFRIRIADPEASYVFNPAGQSIELTGLLCLHDQDGPCANAVKDAQRTKTDAHTLQTFSVVWGPAALAEHTEQTVAWYREIVGRLGAQTVAFE